MRRTLVTAVLALTATAIALGQKQSSSRDQRSSVEQAIRQLDRERIQAQIGADAVALDRIYANDFIGVGTGLSTMVGQDKGKAVPRDTRFTRVWVKQQGRWRLVANHYSLRITQQ